MIPECHLAETIYLYNYYILVSEFQLKPQKHFETLNKMKSHLIWLTVWEGCLILRHIMMSFLVFQRFAITHAAHIYHLCGDITAQMMSLMLWTSHALWSFYHSSCFNHENLLNGYAYLKMSLWRDEDVSVVAL